MLQFLIFAVTYSFAAVVQPGPFQAFLFSQSIANGWKKTVPLVFAPLISDIPIITLVLFILANIPHVFLQGLQCLGGLFLLYLAYNAYMTWKTFYQREEDKIVPQHNIFKAVLVNILNPAPYLTWSMIMGPWLLDAWGNSPAWGIAFLVTFYGSMMIYSILMVMLFSVAGSLGPKVQRISIGFSIIFLAFFGFYQLWLGISGLIA